MADSAADPDAGVARLLDGIAVQKHGRTGTQPRILALSRSLDQVTWRKEKDKTNPKHKQIQVAQITSLVKGETRPALRRQASKAGRTLLVVTPDATLDFECSTPDERDLVASALQSVLDQSKTGSLEAISTLREQLEADVIPVFEARLQKTIGGTGSPVNIRVDWPTFAASSDPVRAVSQISGRFVLGRISEALEKLCQDDATKKAFADSLSKIIIRHRKPGTDARTIFKDGTLLDMVEYGNKFSDHIDYTPASALLGILETGSGVKVKRMAFNIQQNVFDEMTAQLEKSIGRKIVITANWPTFSQARNVHEQTAALEAVGSRHVCGKLQTVLTELCQDPVNQKGISDAIDKIIIRFSPTESRDIIVHHRDRTLEEVFGMKKTGEVVAVPAPDLRYLLDANLKLREKRARHRLDTEALPDLQDRIQRSLGISVPIHVDYSSIERSSNYPLACDVVISKHVLGLVAQVIDDECKDDDAKIGLVEGLHKIVAQFVVTPEAESPRDTPDLVRRNSADAPAPAGAAGDTDAGYTSPSESAPQLTRSRSRKKSVTRLPSSIIGQDSPRRSPSTSPRSVINVADDGRPVVMCYMRGTTLYLQFSCGTAPSDPVYACSKADVQRALYQACSIDERQVTTRLVKQIIPEFAATFAKLTDGGEVELVIKWGSFEKSIDKAKALSAVASDQIIGKIQRIIADICAKRDAVGKTALREHLKKIVIEHAQPEPSMLPPINIGPPAAASASSSSAPPRRPPPRLPPSVTAASALPDSPNLPTISGILSSGIDISPGATPPPPATTQARASPPASVLPARASPSPAILPLGASPDLAATPPPAPTPTASMTGTVYTERLFMAKERHTGSGRRVLFPSVAQTVMYDEARRILEEGCQIPYYAALEHVKELEIPKYQDRLKSAVGKDVPIDIDWSSFASLPNRAAALRLLASEHALEKVTKVVQDACRDVPGRAGIATHLKRVQVCHTGPGMRDAGCRIENGAIVDVLTIPDDPECGPDDVVGARYGDVRKMVVSAFFLRERRTIHTVTRKVIPAYAARISKAVGHSIRVDLDTVSLRRAEAADLLTEAYKKVASDYILGKLARVIEELCRDDVGRDGIRRHIKSIVIHYAHDASKPRPEDPDLFAHGVTTFVDDNQCLHESFEVGFDHYDNIDCTSYDHVLGYLEHHCRVAEDRMVRDMREKIAPMYTDRLADADLVERALFKVEVDWDSFTHALDHRLAVRALCEDISAYAIWPLVRAILPLAEDAQAKDALMQSLRGFRIKNIGASGYGLANSLSGRGSASAGPGAGAGSGTAPAGSGRSFGPGSSPGDDDADGAMAAAGSGRASSAPSARQAATAPHSNPLIMRQTFEYGQYHASFSLQDGVFVVVAPFGHFLSQGTVFATRANVDAAIAKAFDLQQSFDALKEKRARAESATSLDSVLTGHTDDEEEARQRDLLISGWELKRERLAREQELRDKLLQGGVVMRFNKGAATKYLIQCNEKLTRVFWSPAEGLSKGTLKSKDTLLLADVNDIIEGNMSAQFRQSSMDTSKAKHVDNTLCFSLVSQKKTLDFGATTTQERDEWVQAFRLVVQQRAKELKAVLEEVANVTVPLYESRLSALVGQPIRVSVNWDSFSRARHQALAAMAINGPYVLGKLETVVSELCGRGADEVGQAALARGIKTVVLLYRTSPKMTSGIKDGTLSDVVELNRRFADGVDYTTTAAWTKMIEIATCLRLKRQQRALATKQIPEIETRIEGVVGKRIKVDVDWGSFLAGSTDLPAVSAGADGSAQLRQLAHQQSQTLAAMEAVASKFVLGKLASVFEEVCSDDYGKEVVASEVKEIRIALLNPEDGDPPKAASFEGGVVKDAFSMEKLPVCVGPSQWRDMIMDRLGLRVHQLKIHLSTTGLLPYVDRLHQCVGRRVPVSIDFKSFDSAHDKQKAYQVITGRASLEKIVALVEAYCRDEVTRAAVAERLDGIVISYLPEMRDVTRGSAPCQFGVSGAAVGNAMSPQASGSMITPGSVADHSKRETVALGSRQASAANTMAMLKRDSVGHMLGVAGFMQPVATYRFPRYEWHDLCMAVPARVLPNHARLDRYGILRDFFYVGSAVGDIVHTTDQQMRAYLDAELGIGEKRAKTELLDMMLPRVVERLFGLLKKSVRVDVDWESFQASQEPARALRGVTSELVAGRVIRALEEVCKDPLGKAVVADSLKSITFRYRKGVAIPGRYWPPGVVGGTLEVPFELDELNYACVGVHPGRLVTAIETSLEIQTRRLINSWTSGRLLALRQRLISVTNRTQFAVDIDWASMRHSPSLLICHVETLLERVVAFLTTGMTQEVGQQAISVRLKSVRIYYKPAVAFNPFVKLVRVEDGGALALGFSAEGDVLQAATSETMLKCLYADYSAFIDAKAM